MIIILNNLKYFNIIFFQFLYAFHIEPLVNLDNRELTKQPEDATECPYQLSQLQDSNVKDVSI